MKPATTLWCRSLSPLQLVLMATLLADGPGRDSPLRCPGRLVRGLFLTVALLKGDYVDPTDVVLAEAGGPHPGDAALVVLTLIDSPVGTLLSSALVALILDQLLLARLVDRPEAQATGVASDPA